MSETTNNNRDMIVAFSKIYLFLKRYFIILLLSIICGIGYGWYKNHYAGYYFKKHLLISSIVLEKHFSTDIISSIQILIEDNNTETLAKKLNIPKIAAASLIKIDTSSFHIRENLGFMIDFSFYDSVYADTITSGLMHLLNNNEYYQKNMQLFVKEKRKLLDALNLKQRLNDSIGEGANAIYSSSHGGNTVFVRSLSSEQIGLTEEKYRLEKDIEFGSKISVVNESMTRVFAGIGLTKSIILYGLGLGLLGIFLSLLIESLRLTLKYLKEQKK